MRQIVTVVGARPQFIKGSVISRQLSSSADLKEVLVHTGQHYDFGMSDRFFEELGIPAPTYSLGVGSGTHAAQTAEMLRRLEEILLEVKPALVFVYGDTNSTLAAALAAAKLTIPLAHIEAGLRSFNRQMPEEINRVVTDHVSTLNFCPTLAAVKNLAAEGIVKGVEHVGDVMYDVALTVSERADASSSFRDTGLAHRGFILATAHRAGHTDDRATLESIFGALTRLAKRYPVVFPAHPRTRHALAAHGLQTPGIRLVDPVGMIDMAWLERHAALIVTDSGGVQKEAYFHRTPCVTMRTETEWIETVAAGWNHLANPGDADAIVRAAEEALERGAPTTEIAEYGNGHAAERIIAKVTRFLS